MIGKYDPIVGLAINLLPSERTFAILGIYFIRKC